MREELLLAARERQLGGEAISGKEDLFGFFLGAFAREQQLEKTGEQRRKERKRRVLSLLWMGSREIKKKKKQELFGKEGKERKEKTKMVGEEQLLA